MQPNTSFNENRNSILLIKYNIYNEEAEIMKVAILMASYNGEKYISEQIDSIISQSFTEWSLYINDDGSTDRTIDIIKRYITEFPDKICLSYNNSERHGATGNFADLFQKVPHADWYVFCDQDDVWINNRLEKMLAEANLKGLSNTIIPAIVYGKAKVVDENLNIIADSIEECMHIELKKENAKKQVLLSGYIWGCTMMYNDALRKIVKKIPYGAYYHDFYLVIACLYFGKVIALEETVVMYRQHSANTSSGINPLFIDICIRLKHIKGILKRIRNLRDVIKLQIQTFLIEFHEELSEESRKQVTDCIKILEYKSRIHSLFSAIQKKYLGWNGYDKYSVFLLLVKGKSY